MYEYSTKLGTEKHGLSRSARMIPAPEGTGVIRADLLNSSNSRSIFVLQKNGKDAESLQKLVQNAVQMRVQKSHDADEYAANRADDFADSFPGSDNQDARNG